MCTGSSALSVVLHTTAEPSLLGSLPAVCSCVSVDTTAGSMFVPCLSICVCVCVQVHLLCLLSYTLQQNRLCSSDFLQSVALSLLPSARISPETWRVSTLTDYVYWFRQILDIVPSLRRNGDMVRIAGSVCEYLPFWYRLTQVVPDKRPLNGYMYCCNTLQVNGYQLG